MPGSTSKLREDTVEGSRVLRLTYRAGKLQPELLGRLAKLPGGGRRFLTAPASIDWEGRRLVLQLWSGQLELQLPWRALSWLRDREREVEPLKPVKLALLRWRESALEVRVILKVQRPKPERPSHRRALLVYVRAAEYGFAVITASYDEEYTKIYEAMKFVPRAVRLRLAKRAGEDVNREDMNQALEDYSPRRWVEAAAAAIFAKARWRARGRSILMNIDAPGSETRGVPRSRFRRALLSIREVAENLANWHGVYATFESHPSSECPLCGRELRELGTGLVRIVQCECGFYEDGDYVPFYHWFKELGLPLPKHPIRQLPKPEA